MESRLPCHIYFKFLKLESTFHPLDAIFNTSSIPRWRKNTRFLLNSSPYRESIPRRNRFLTGNKVRGIDAWGPEKFKKSGLRYNNLCTWYSWNEGTGGTACMGLFYCQSSKIIGIPRMPTSRISLAGTVQYKSLIILSHILGKQPSFKSSHPTIIPRMRKSRLLCRISTLFVASSACAQVFNAACAFLCYSVQPPCKF